LEIDNDPNMEAYENLDGVLERIGREILKIRDMGSPSD
jgi:hypothetical protein